MQSPDQLAVGVETLPIACAAHPSAYASTHLHVTLQVPRRKRCCKRARQSEANICKTTESRSWPGGTGNAVPASARGQRGYLAHSILRTSREALEPIAARTRPPCTSLAHSFLFEHLSGSLLACSLFCPASQRFAWCASAVEIVLLQWKPAHRMLRAPCSRCHEQPQTRCDGITTTKQMSIATWRDAEVGQWATWDSSALPPFFFTAGARPAQTSAWTHMREHVNMWTQPP